MGGIFGDRMGDLPGGALGSVIAGPFGLIAGTDNPISNAFTGRGAPAGFVAPSMNQTAQNQVTQNQNNLLKTPEQHAQELMAGTGAANQVQNQTGRQANEQKQLGGGGIDGMTEAIGQKAQKNFAPSQAKLQKQSEFAGANMTMNNTNMAAANAISIANAQRGVDSQVMRFNLESNAARYATISGLMAGAGSIGGMIAGGKHGAAPGGDQSLPSTSSAPNGGGQGYLGGNYDFNY